MNDRKKYIFMAQMFLTFLLSFLGAQAIAFRVNEVVGGPLGEVLFWVIILLGTWFAASLTRFVSNVLK